VASADKKHAAKQKRSWADLKREKGNAIRSQYGLRSYDGVDAIKYATVFQCFSAALCDTRF